MLNLEIYDQNRNILVELVVNKIRKIIIKIINSANYLSVVWIVPLT